MQKKHARHTIAPAARTSKYAVSPTKERWASDVIVDLMHCYDLPHAALNPGASYRGPARLDRELRAEPPDDDALPARGDAVQIAHGYAKATGKPMIAILHNLVGLLHANMAIYYAYIDRAPVFIVGRHGPDGRDQAAPAHRLDPHRAGAGRGRQAIHEVGLPAAHHRRRARSRSRAPTA
jgi:hypothetical protein